MIHSIFILNNNGQVIIEKHYRGNATRTESVSFWSQTEKSSKGIPTDVPPFLSTPKGALVHFQRNGLFLLASVLSDTQPIFVTQFLSSLADTLEDYFGELNEHAIKDNFITVYELLDEMLDNGHPLTLEPNSLKELIAAPSMLNRVLDSLGADSPKTLPSSMGPPPIIPWRKPAVKYAQNEVFVDVIETIDAIFSSSKRSMSHLIVHGNVRVNSRLSGTPDVTMHMRCNNKGIGGGIGLSENSIISNHIGSAMFDDVSLHHCVRSKKYEDSGILSFVPPDGPFKLMDFTIRDTSALSLPVDAQARVERDEHAGTASVSVSLISKFTPPAPPQSRMVAPATGAGAGIRSSRNSGIGSIGSGVGGGIGNTTTNSSTAAAAGSMMLASVMNAAGASAKGLASFYDQDAVMDEVVVRIPFGPGVSGAALSANVGTVQFDSSTGMCTWNVGVVSRGKTPSMLGNITVEKEAMARIVNPPVLLQFRIPGYSVSGITVDSLELGTSETYRYYKGLRCITRAGTYEVRP